jgi:hypothetical protein
MSIFQERLLVVTDTITSLDIRIRELERLRDQNKKAQLSARRLRPKSRRKRTRISNDKAAFFAGLFKRLRSAAAEPDETILALSRNRKPRTKRRKGAGGSYEPFNL